MSISVFEQARIALQTFLERMESQTIRSNLLTYSDTEIGQRHTDLPLGTVYRDQGQFDLYAGQTRVIGDIWGQLAVISSAFVSTAKNVAFPSISWFDVTIGSRVLNEKLDLDYKLLIVKKDLKLEDYFVMDQTTRADPNTGEIYNKIPLTKIVEKEYLFTNYELVDTPEQDHHDLFMDKVGKK